jgi:hypothetical protein
VSQVIQASAGLSDQTGFSYQGHLVYLINAAKWLVSWQDNASDTTWKLLTNANNDFTGGSWSVPTGSPFTFTNPWTDNGTNKSGANHSLAYKNISSNDVLHMDRFFKAGSSFTHSHLRAHFSGTTVTVDSQNDFGDGIGSVNTSNGGPPWAVGGNFTTGNRPVVVFESGSAGGPEAQTSANSDSGTSWTDDIGGGTNVPSASEIADACGACVFPLASNGALVLAGDGSASAPTTMQNVSSAKFTNGVGWGSAVSVGFTALGAGVSANNFGGIGVTTSDIHCVLRTGSNTYSHRRYNGTSWSAAQSIPNQNSKAGAGLFMATDGTDVWLFIIDSDAANTVRYIKWTAATPAWDATWTAVETPPRRVML